LSEDGIIENYMPTEYVEYLNLTLKITISDYNCYINNCSREVEKNWETFKLELLYQKTSKLSKISK